VSSVVTTQEHATQEHTATDVVAVHDFAEWKRIVSNSFVPLEVTSEDAEAFRGRMKSRAVGEILITEITASSHQVHRTLSLIAQNDKKYIKMSLQMSGTGLLMQDGRQAILGPGDIAIYDTSRPYTLEFHGDFRSLVVMFPHSHVDLPADALARLTATRIVGDEGIARLVGPFLVHLARNMDRLVGHSGIRLVHNAIDLVTTVLYSQLDSAENDTSTTHRASLLREVHAYIDTHLSDPDLSPRDIAAATYISTRHLHGIFKEQGVTVSAWIRSRRLEHCRRDLTDPLLDSKPVSAIAARWGFTDASHFSRLFRATFGEAPTRFRTESRRNLTVESAAS
jgi:AraC-like DNA-binding protein